MKKLLIIAPLGAFVLVTNVNAQDNSNIYSGKEETVVINAPFQSELTKIYKEGEKFGVDKGKKTKNFLCSELKIEFFCKGD